jgi:hypothetical protein
LAQEFSQRVQKATERLLEKIRGKR